jgi:hypothetical protein
MLKSILTYEIILHISLIRDFLIGKERYFSHLWCDAVECGTWVPAFHPYNLRMETIDSLEKLVPIYKTTGLHIREERNLSLIQVSY